MMRLTSAPYVCLVAACLVLLSSTTAAQGSANGTAAAAAGGFVCGAPLGPCGSAIPAGVTCAKGAGWCQASYFCGWEENTGQPSRCLPLPKNCGTEGNACCPSNTNKPHTSMEDKLNAKPFCKDGSTCFFFRPIPGLPNGDMYAGNNGAYLCAKVAPDCGLKEGAPCCPLPYKTAANPPLARIGCPGVQGGYCNFDVNYVPKNPPYPAIGSAPAARPGVCAAQSPGCGQFGKGCCFSTTGVSDNSECGARYGQSGPHGYCANPFVPSGNPYDKARPAASNELVCTKCPDKLDPAVKTSNPSLYFSCANRR